MCSDETNEFSANESNEPTDDFSADVHDEATGSEVEPTPKAPWNRRTFLKAAALGAAAAALINKDNAGGLHFGAASALANDLSGYPCTAQDFSVGLGIIQNPCDCTSSGTFTALVAFPVTSTQNATRKCITFHVPGSGDIILRNTLQEAKDGSGDSFFSGSGIGTMYAKISNFPCNTTGTICLGTASTGTIAWSTSNTTSLQCTSADQTPPKGQCRHQALCIQGVGATLDCDLVTTGIQTACNVACGSSATLQACGSGAGTLTYKLYKGTSSTGTLLATQTGTGCKTFTVTPPIGSTTYTLTVTDSNNCPHEATVTLTTTAPSAPTLVQTSANCAGVVVLTATASDSGTAGDTFNFGGATGTVSGNTITLQPQLDGVCRTVTVTLTRGGCTSAATSYSFSQCATTTECV